LQDRQTPAGTQWSKKTNIETKIRREKSKNKTVQTLKMER